MKSFLLIIIASSLMSCEKCQDCTIKVASSTETHTVCQDDFYSKQEYKDYIKSVEANGGNCK